MVELNGIPIDSFGLDLGGLHCQIILGPIPAVLIINHNQPATVVS